MKRLKILVAIACYLATFVWAYAVIVSPAFAYNGYKFIWRGWLGMIWLIILTLAPATFLPTAILRPSALVSWWLYMTVYVPSVLLSSFSLTLSLAELFPLDIALLVCMSALILVSSTKVLAISPISVPAKVYWPVIMFVWLSCLIFVCAHFNASTLIRNLASLFLGGSEYTIRYGFLDELSQSGRVLGYMTGQIGEALDPFLISYGLVYKQKRFVIGGIVGQLMIFAVLGAKSIFFSTMFIVLVYWMVRRFRYRIGTAFSVLLIAVVLVSAAVDKMSDGIFLTSITTRRTLMDPGILTGFYFEHYLTTAHAGIAYHFPRGGEAVVAPSQEIGLVYFGDEHIDANANLWAQGFADFGISGILGFTFVLALMMWMYDSIAARQNFELAVLMVSMPAFAFSNSAPLTVFFTHGALASALLLWSAPRREPVELAVEDGWEVDAPPHTYPAPAPILS